MDIQKASRNYMLRSAVLTAGLCAMSGGAMLTAALPLALPTLVSVLFVLTVDVASVVLFRWVATNHADMLTSFFTGVSGVRFLMALALMAVWYLVADSESMKMFFVVFLLFYMVTLVHQSVFFSRISNRL
jgi:hypothetical protein